MAKAPHIVLLLLFFHRNSQVIMELTLVEIKSDTFASIAEVTTGLCHDVGSRGQDSADESRQDET